MECMHNGFHERLSGPCITTSAAHAGSKTDPWVPVLQDGMQVTFSEVIGMEELNNGRPRKVKNCKVCQSLLHHCLLHWHDVLNMTVVIRFVMMFACAYHLHDMYWLQISICQT